MLQQAPFFSTSFGDLVFYFCDPNFGNYSFFDSKIVSSYKGSVQHMIPKSGSSSAYLLLALDLFLLDWVEKLLSDPSLTIDLDFLILRPLFEE